MSKDPYRDANAPPPYDFNAAPGPHYGPGPGQGGGMYPQLGPEYGPPQGGAPYVPPHGPQFNPQPPQVVHVNQPVTIAIPVLVGPSAVRTQCPSCHANIKTAISYSSSMKTHLCAVLLCLFGCCLCMCIPYCMASCKDTTHKCPNCKAFLGVYRA